jgi:tetratricopeptide (TPR) repeat protein
MNLFIRALIFAAMYLAVPMQTASAQDNCATVFTEAEKMYEAGRYAQAIELLKPCLPDGIPKIQRILAYRLLALAYLDDEYRNEAKEAIKKIFGINFDYKPDPVKDPPRYRSLVEEVKKDLPTPLGRRLFGGNKKWFWVGGGVVTAGAVGFLARKDKTPENDLPEPPALP